MTCQIQSRKMIFYENYLAQLQSYHYSDQWPDQYEKKKRKQQRESDCRVQYIFLSLIVFFSSVVLIDFHHSSPSAWLIRSCI